MAKRNNVWANVDWVSITLFLILMLIGWINIYSAVYNEEHRNILDMGQRYGKQAIWIVAAIVIAASIIMTDSRFFVTFAYPIYAFTILLLISVLFFGADVKGARAWFQIGSFTLQPSEFTKLATSLALAKYISNYNFRIQNFRSLVSIGFIILLPVLLIFLQNDTGSALVFGVFLLVLYREGLNGIVLFFSLLTAIVFVLTLVLRPFATIIILGAASFIAHYLIRQRFKETGTGILIAAGTYGLFYLLNLILGNPMKPMHILLITVFISFIVFYISIFRKRLRNLYLILGIFAGSVLFTMSVDYVFTAIMEPHQQARIEELLGIRSDPLGVGYNVNQSKIAIGSGGFFGKGFLDGTQTKFDFVPEQSTDFIFCTVGEEWGFLGSMFVIGLFLALLIRLVNLAERQRSTFSRVYGYSVACILFFHLAINIGMTIGLAPVIGIPLPLFSYGGSSLWSFTLLLFIFLRLDASRFEQLSF